MAQVHYPGESNQAKDHIEEVLKGLKDNLGNEYHLVSTFLVEGDGKLVDLLVIAPHALFVVTVPNLRGLVVPYKGDMLWTHGAEEVSESNPFADSTECISAVQNMIRTKMRGASMDVEWLVVLPSAVNRLNRQVDTALTDDDKNRVLKLENAHEFIAASYARYLEEPTSSKVLSQTGIENIIKVIANQNTLTDMELELIDIRNEPNPTTQAEFNAQTMASQSTTPVMQPQTRSWQTGNVVILSIVAIALIAGGVFVANQYIGRTTGCQPPAECTPPPPPEPTKLPDGTIQAPQHGSVIHSMGVQFIPFITDPDKQITDYHWVFGDGEESDDITPFHRYAKAGVYTTSLTLSGQGFETFSTISEITISDEISDRACDPSQPLPNLVVEENPVIILTREEFGQEFAIKNGLFAPLDAKGFVSIDPTVLANIKDEPVIERIWKGDCDSMASLAAYFNSYTLITVQYFLEQTSTSPIAFLATVQLVAINPMSGREMFRDFKESVARGVSADQAQRNALLAAATMGGELLAEKLATYFEL